MEMILDDFNKHALEDMSGRTFVLIKIEVPKEYIPTDFKICSFLSDDLVSAFLPDGDGYFKTDENSIVVPKGETLFISLQNTMMNISDSVNPIKLYYGVSPRLIEF